MVLSFGIALQLLAITNTAVIDPSNGTARADQTVIVRGARIEAVSPTRSTPVPAGARRVDGRGTFIIPGMWDMHVHNDIPGGRGLLPMFVAHGVTGVRDMNGRLDVLRGWQREIAAGRQVGPRMFISGPYVIGQAVPLPHLIARTAEEGARAVDSLAKLGVDFIKVHNALTPPAYFGAARRARERGVVFAGHVFPPVTPVQAADSGQRSLEHLTGFVNECTPSDSTRFAGAHPLQRLLLEPCTSNAQGASYSRIAAKATWVTPTLIVQGPVAELRPSVTRGDRGSAFFTDSLLDLMAIIMPLPSNPSAAHVALGRELYTRRVALAGALARAGVPLLTGTDSPLTTSPPGESLHDELALLVQAGLTPAQAIRAATYEAARYFAATDSMGTVARGKVADFVVLEANPLTDVRNTRRIRAVVANGTYHDRAALDALIAGARVRR